MGIEEVIDRAQEHAQSGEAWNAVKDLFDREIFGRIRSRLRRQWNWITDAQIDDATVDAYVALYREIASGGSIDDPVAWLATVAWRRAADTMRKTELEELTDPSRVPLFDPDQQVAQERTEQAFAAFAQLVERLTPDGVRRVMAVVCDAYRSGTYTLTNREIAEILGEPTETVKKWRQRGFQRLGRLMQQEGLVDDDCHLDIQQLVRQSADQEDPHDSDR